MAVNIVEAVATIKRSVANCLTPEAIEQACQAEEHKWRQRELGPVETIHAFIVQVLHGNAACSQTVRLAGLNCSGEAYCQARARLPPCLYDDQARNQDVKDIPSKSDQGVEPCDA